MATPNNGNWTNGVYTPKAKPKEVPIVGSADSFIGGYTGKSAPPKSSSSSGSSGSSGSTGTSGGSNPVNTSTNTSVNTNANFQGADGNNYSVDSTGKKTLVGPATTTPVNTPVVTTPTDTTKTTNQTTGNGVAYTYDQLTPEQKSAIDKTGGRAKFDMLGMKGQQELEKYMKGIGQTIAEENKQIDYNAEQAKIQGEAADINNAAQVRQATDTLNKVKANSLYSSASDVTSSAQQTAVGNNLREMSKGIDDLVALHGLQEDSMAKQTAESARRIQQQLTDALGKTVVDALNAMDNGLADGTIATNEQLLTLYKQNQDAILKAAPELTNYAVQQLSGIYDDFQKYTETLNANAKTFQTNSMTISPVSGVTGMATDMNGKPILDTAGQPIPFPKNAPYPPQYINGGTQVAITSLGPDGKINYQVMDVQSPMATSQAQAYVDQGVALENIPENLRTTALQLANQQGKTIPQKASNVNTNINTNTNIANMDSAELYKAITSGQYNGKKFFGVYATGDMDGQRHADYYNGIVNNGGITADLANFPKTKITEEMINNTAAKYNLDPIMIAATVKMDSSYGTAGKGARNNNPGNVGQFDSLDAKGITVEGYKTLQEGLDAVGNNLRKRMNAMGSVAPTTEGEVGFNEADKPLYQQLLGSKGMTATLAQTLADRGIDQVTFAKQAQAWRNDTNEKDLAPTLQNVLDLKNSNAPRSLRLGLGNKATGGLIGAVSGGAADLLNKYDQIRSTLNLNSLIEAKAKGATFGALSDAEGKMLGDAATSLKMTSSDEEWNKQLGIIANKMLATQGKEPMFDDAGNKIGGETPANAPANAPASTPTGNTSYDQLKSSGLFN